MTWSYTLLVGISWSRCWNRANKDKDIYLESVPGRGRGRGKIGLREELICDAGLSKPQPIQWGDSGAITTMSVPLWAEVAGSLHPEGPLHPCLTQSLGTVFPCVEYGLREGSSQQLKLPAVHSSHSVRTYYVSSTFWMLESFGTFGPESKQKN